MATIQQALVDMMVDQVLEGADGIDAQTDLFEAGLDSMAIMQLLLLIDERFGVTLTSSDLTRANFANIDVLSALIASRLRGDTGAAATRG